MDRGGPSRPGGRDGGATPVPGPATQARLSTPASAAGRALAAIVLAVAAGLGLAWLDTRPGFDDTGVLVVLLVIAAFVAVLVDGSGRALRAAMLAVLVGIWIPVFEIAPSGATGALLALAFAVAGAGAGFVALRAAGSGGG